MDWPVISEQEAEEFNRNFFFNMSEDMKDREYLRLQVDYMIQDGAHRELEPFHQDPTFDEWMEYPFRMKEFAMRWIMYRAIQEGIYHPDEPII